MVAIPAYDGRIGAATVRSLLHEQAAAILTEDELRVSILPGCSLITQARNQLAQDFLLSDAERLVFVDSDVAWAPGALVRLAHHAAPVVGGAYRYKIPVEGYPVMWPDKPELWSNAEGLLEVKSLPAGFLAIDRNALDDLRDAHPERGYVWQGRGFHAYFHIPPHGGGEDGAFCADWRALGEQVFLDPELDLTHCDGVTEYPGNIGRWLKSRA